MPNILIIDSDKQVGRHLEENVRAVYDGAALSFSLAGTDEEALTLIDTGQSFDVALVAIDSPGLSGLSVFSRIKEKSFRVPRIAVSSASDLSGIRKAMNDGAVDFLVKPIEVDDFKATIERVLADVERRRSNW